MIEVSENDPCVSINTPTETKRIPVIENPKVKRIMKTAQNKRKRTVESEKSKDEANKTAATKSRLRRPSVFTRIVGRKRATTERKPYYDEKVFITFAYIFFFGFKERRSSTSPNVCPSVFKLELYIQRVF